MANCVLNGINNLDARHLSEITGAVPEKTGQMNGSSVRNTETNTAGYFTTGLEKAKDMARSVLDRAVILNKSFQPKLANYLAFGVVTGFILNSVSGAAAEVVGRPCPDPSWSEFYAELTSQFGGETALLNSDNADLISAINKITRDQPELAEAAMRYLMSGGTIRDGISSKILSDQSIFSAVNYGFDRGVYSAMNNSMVTRTLQHFIEDEALLSGPVPEYVKQAMSATCVPENSLTKSCGELTQKDFLQVLGDALGRDTPVYNGEGIATGLDAQLDRLRESNPELADAALRWLNDPTALKEGVAAKSNGETLSTILEYAKDRFNYDNNPRTLAHIECCEINPDQVLQDYQAAAFRPGCPLPLSTTEQVAVSAAASTTGAYILGGFGFGMGLAGLVAAGFAYYKATRNSNGSNALDAVSLGQLTRQPSLSSTAPIVSAESTGRS